MPLKSLFWHNLFISTSKAFQRDILMLSKYFRMYSIYSCSSKA